MKGAQQGVALVVVLWMTMLLGLLAAGYAFSVQTEMRVVSHIREEARARALADAAHAYVKALVQARPPTQLLEEGGPPWLDGRPWIWSFGGYALELRLVPAAGLVDLNRAKPELLELALTFAGIPADRAGELVDQLQDWRDKDDEPRSQGAEDADYQEAGIAAGAKDASFESVEEIGQVLGIDRAVSERLRPLLTVRGGQGLNPQFVPLEIQAMLAGDHGTPAGTEEAESEAVDRGAVPAQFTGAGRARFLHLRVRIAALAGGKDFSYGFSAASGRGAGRKRTSSLKSRQN
ncbi:MAG: hypothetical protein ABFS23_04170 [Pseudomonadota bacterium]